MSPNLSFQKQKHLL